MPFDQFVAVDWSACAKRNKGKNSIWIAACDIEGALHLENPNTRQAAMDRIESLLEEASAAGRRVLCGFDFSFGYPKGTARMLTGRAGWEAVWERIAEEIDDRLDNRNDSFQAAARLNGCFEGEGPFWGLPAGRQIEGSAANEAARRLGTESAAQASIRRGRGPQGTGGVETLLSRERGTAGVDRYRQAGGVAPAPLRCPGLAIRDT